MENNNTVTLEVEKKENIGVLLLWILGWIFCFPIPALILIWRRKNTWNQATKALATIALVVLVLFTSILSSILGGIISYTRSTNTEIEEEVAEDVLPNLLTEAQNFVKGEGDWQTDVIEKCSFTDYSEIDRCRKLAEAICKANDPDYYYMKSNPTVIRFDEDNILIVADSARFPQIDQIFPTTVLVEYDPTQSEDDYSYELHYCQIGDRERYDDGIFEDEWKQFKVMENLKS